MPLTITPLPTPPTRAEPTTFSAQSDAFLAALPAFGTEANALGAEVETNAIEARTAQGYALTAEAAAVSAAAASAATKWVSGTTYAEGVGVWSPVDFKTYRRKTNGAGTTDPSADATNWAVLTYQKTMQRSERTSNTILTYADSGNEIDITSGTFSQTFSSCASLGLNWYCYLKNSGTGTITLDPNAAETIDGLASYIMYPGESRLITADGGSLKSKVLTTFYTVFTATGTFVKPPGYARFECQLWGGGASGHRSGTSALGGGGGACAIFSRLPANLSASETVTIGDGGAAQSTFATDGNAGGTSIFAGISAFGGLGNGTGGSAFITGLDSGKSDTIGGGRNSTTVTEMGGGGSSTSAGDGRTIYGGSAGGALDGGTPTLYGVSIFGGVGGAAVSAGAGGIAGTAPGGGGGGTNTGTASGAGARGELRIWGIA